MPSRTAPRPGRPCLLACSLALLVALGGCTSDDGAGRAVPGSPTRAGGRTTDPGSRYMDAGGPIGGLTAETPPATGHAPAVTGP